MAVGSEMGEGGVPNSDDALFAEANQWLFRLAADDVSAADRDRFSAWLRTSPAHRQAWNEAQALMTALRKPAQASYEASRADRRRASLHIGVQYESSSRRMRWLGATLVMALAVAGYIEGPLLFDRWRADVLTLAGQRQKTTLADGTRVELDSDTALKVDMSGSQRRVTVLRGEAFFDIAKNDRPFVVAVGVAELRDIGTAFAVNRLDDGATATVENGIVDVDIPSAPQKAVRLKAGEKVEIGAKGVSPAKKANLDDELAWRRGQIVFRQMRLSEVVVRLNRYRQGRIVIGNPWISSQLVSGSFNTDQPDVAIEALEGVLGISAIRITSYLTVLR